MFYYCLSFRQRKCSNVCVSEATERGATPGDGLQTLSCKFAITPLPYHYHTLSYSLSPSLPSPQHLNHHLPHTFCFLFPPCHRSQKTPRSRWIFVHCGTTPTPASRTYRDVAFSWKRTRLPRITSWPRAATSCCLSRTAREKKSNMQSHLPPRKTATFLSSMYNM